MLARKGFWLRGKPHQSGSIQFHWESETKQGFFPSDIDPISAYWFGYLPPFLERSENPSAWACTFVNGVACDPNGKFVAQLCHCQWDEDQLWTWIGPYRGYEQMWLDMIPARFRLLPLRRALLRTAEQTTAWSLDHALEPFLWQKWVKNHGAYATLLADRPAWGAHSEWVHDIRVYGRRLRQLMSLFAGVSWHKHEKVLKRLHRSCNDLRDLDCLAAQFPTLQTSKRFEQSHLAAWEGFLAVRDTLDLERYQADALLAEWRDRVPFFKLSIGEMVQAILHEAQVALAGWPKLHKKSPSVDYHQVRISAKQWRYRLEFFTEVAPPVRPLVKAFKDIQDQLGLLQDRAQAKRWLKKFQLNNPEYYRLKPTKTLKENALNCLAKRMPQLQKKIQSLLETGKMST